MSKLEKENDKALRYIGQLDVARCNGQWQGVIGLVRKIQKHAPQRKCLALSAQSEPQVEQHATKPSSTSSSALAQLIPPLLTAVEAERTFAQDAFHARVCLGEIHLRLEEPSLAVSRLPIDFAEILKDLTQDGSKILGWTRVCALKGACIRGESLIKAGATQRATETMRSVLPLLSTTPTSEVTGPQFQLWSERLLTRLCLVSSEQSWCRSGGLVGNVTAALEAFRSWANFWRGSPAQGLGGAQSIENSIPRRQVWKHYYTLISRILQTGVAFPPYVTTPSIAKEDGSHQIMTLRAQQISEIKYVETMYESLLLKEVKFPKAQEQNQEIESWVDMVVQNWNVVCGSGWQDEELGKGGKEATSRNLLDILYRAATKTFHSTPILRRLFSVHSYLAEFDLAIKAFDSYLEIVTRGKARVERSGVPDPGLDNDDMIIKTAAECINIICRFGAKKEAEKARDLGETILKWLSSVLPLTSQPTTNGTKPIASTKDHTTTFDVSPQVIALAYKAIGISQAHWARLTYESSSRAEIQRSAILSLRRALDPDLGRSADVDALYALGLILAETRDLNGAIEVVKHALQPRPGQFEPTTADGLISETPLANQNSPLGNDFAKEKKLIPVWHLLALLLTAKQDFNTAVKACEATFEQFGDPINLFGPPEPTAAREDGVITDSSATSFNEKIRTVPAWNVVDNMEGYEKDTVIQVKITQLALIELLEGPELAVNASDELLSLFARLFRDQDIQLKTDDRTKESFMPPPKSSSGTIGSLKGSLFGRPKSMKANAPAGKAVAVPPVHSRAVGNDLAPIISVTDEDNKPINRQEHHHHRHHFFHHEGHHGERLRKRSGSDGRPKSKGSIRGRKKNDSDRTSTAFEDQRSTVQFATAQHEDVFAHSTREEPNPYNPKSNSDNRLSTATSASQVGLAVSQDIPSPITNPAHNSQMPGHSLPLIPHNLPRKQQPPPISHPNQPPQQDVRLPTALPGHLPTQLGPQFPSTQKRRQALGLLVKVWLIVAGLYRRSALYEDGEGAIDEAFKLVEGLEIEIAKVDSSSKAFSERGWGGGKSIDHLWGDVWAERGSLAQAQSTPHKALSHFEQALSHFPDHPSATVGVATILLDISTQTISPASTLSSRSSSSNHPLTTTSFSATHPSSQSPTQTPRSGSQTPNPNPTSRPSPLGLPIIPIPSATASATAKPTTTHHPQPHNNLGGTTSEELDRLAARDRAYGLLNSLTKLGTGWDYSDAWFALARAYEEGGQVDKARDVLWWCVELEEGRAIRHWWNVSLGGYVL